MGRLSRDCKHKLKGYNSYKKKYTVNNLGLVNHNKRFFYAAVGDPASTHDTCFLKSALLYNEIVGGSVIHHWQVTLGNLGIILSMTIVDTAFPRFSWLLKS